MSLHYIQYIKPRGSRGTMIAGAGLIKIIKKMIYFKKWKIILNSYLVLSITCRVRSPKK